MQSYHKQRGTGDGHYVRASLDSRGKETNALCQPCMFSWCQMKAVGMMNQK